VLLWLRDTSPIHNTHVLLLKNFKYIYDLIMIVI
jgi:hypothetical protein